MKHNIHHDPILNTENIIHHYSEKDGVAIKYVCTSALGEYSEKSADIFYRDTPHPEFGNRYFGIFVNYDNNLYITNADKIEDLGFGMIEHEGVYYYSRDRHDCVPIPNSSKFIDGGRAYVRVGGNPTPMAKMFIVKDGEFKIKE